MYNIPLNLLRSYLRATGIQYTRSTVAGCDLTVVCQDGNTIEVRVVLRNDTTAPCECVDVVGSHLTGKSLNKALAAFHTVSRAAGYGEPMPFNRGAEPEHKLSYMDEEFLVAIRHNETRRAPNPEPAKFVAYDKVMYKAVWTFYKLNNMMCRRWGLGVDDLMQIARTLLVNFCARYEDDLEPQSQNERILYTYLHQRFAEVYAVMGKKERSCFPDADTVCIASTGIPYQSDGMFSEALSGVFNPESEPEKIDVDHRDRNRKLDCSNPTKRKASAAKMLKEGLGAMDHDRMVETLTFAAQNILIAHDARRHAAKLLREHAAECPDCYTGSESLGVDEDEESTGVDAGCAQE